MSKSPTEPETGNSGTRIALRVAGIALMGAGALLSAVGLWSFFSAFGTFQPPRYFWAVMVGFPIIAVGASLTGLGYMSAAMRYYTGEVTPVATQTFKSMAEGMSGGVETIAKAMARGMSSRSGSEAESLLCEKCNAVNGADAKFCQQCGTPLSRRTCAGCGSALAAGARFCGQCGKVVG